MKKLLLTMLLLLLCSSLHARGKDECGFPEFKLPGQDLVSTPEGNSAPTDWLEENREIALTATALLRQPNRSREHDEPCTYEAIRHWGSAKNVTKDATQADIDLAIEYLAFKHDDHGFIFDPFSKCPAIPLFSVFGKKSVPALIDVIAGHSADSVWTANATFGLILATDPTDFAMGLHAIENAVASEKDNGRLFNLQTALEAAKNRYCWQVLQSKPAEPICAGQLH